jgi:tRNA A-37 threonylcarbamoyl transferase component Bud32/tetratricopeptide (TPR) repeat protein
VDCAACHQPLADGAEACGRCGQPVSDPWIGRKLGGRYQLTAPLGRGGMGTVYRAEHLLMKKEVAIKLLHPELSRLDEVAKRFEREAQSASRLDHPNIIQVTDFGRTDEGALFLVMELLLGESLSTVIERGPVAPPRATAIAVQVLRALEHAHGEGVVHRDLKPDNIYLVRREGDDPLEQAAGGRIKLLDFGIAKVDVGSTGESLTQAGVVFGTPEYISPEQAVGEPADARADLYALGVILFEMVAGKRPFHAESKVQLLSMHLTRPPPLLRDLAPDAPPALERAVSRALEKRRDQRWPSAATFREALMGGAPSLTGQRAIALPGWVRTPQVALRRAWTRSVLAADRSGIPYPRATVGTTAGLAAALLLTLFAQLVRPAQPRPAPPPAIASADLERAESLLAHADLAGARAALQQQLSAHPDVARVHYLLGNLHFAEGQREQALGDYRAAIHLDAGYRGDPVLLANGRELLDGKPSESVAAMALLATDVGGPAVERLADCATSCREMHTRRAAADAVIKLGGAAALPTSARSTDADLGRLVDELDNGKACKDRKRAVLELRDLGDPRAIEPLKRARDRRGGMFGFGRYNGCAVREIDDALRVLGSKP